MVKGVVNMITVVSASIKTSTELCKFACLNVS